MKLYGRFLTRCSVGGRQIPAESQCLSKSLYNVVVLGNEELVVDELTTIRKSLGEP